MDFKAFVIETCQGNPGALEVLVKLANCDAEFTFVLCKEISHSGSTASALWRVYKDVCNYDIEKTKLFLIDWMRDCSPNITLEIYLEQRGFTR